MSSLALMRFLEDAPRRYDAGMRVLTLGRIASMHAAMAEAVPEGSRVLEIGCGTGLLTERLVGRAARVTAIDQSPPMLEQARQRLAAAGSGALTLVETTASEIGALPERDFDAVATSFCLSEMSAGEREFVLTEVARRLRPGGRLIVGDEVRPRAPAARALHAVLRAPQAALGWLLVGSVSAPLRCPANEIERAGLKLRSEQRWLLGSFAVLVAERPA